MISRIIHRASPVMKYRENIRDSRTAGVPFFSGIFTVPVARRENLDSYRSTVVYFPSNVVRFSRRRSYQAFHIYTFSIKYISFQNSRDSLLLYIVYCGTLKKKKETCKKMYTLDFRAITYSKGLAYILREGKVDAVGPHRKSSF